MAYKNIENQKAAAKRWYEKNKKKVIRDVSIRTKIYSTRNKEYVRKLKESNPCKDCGKFYKYYQMDFDHIEEKDYEVARMIMESRSLESIQKEIDKCELVCSNCHRQRTWERSQVS